LLSPSPSQLHRSPNLGQLHIVGMQGLGDNIFQRNFIHTLSRQYEIYLETSWPEFYADLPIKPVKPTTRLRTQLKNVNRARVQWWPKPVVHRKNFKTISYVQALRSGRSIISGMEHAFGIELDPTLFDLPTLPPCPIDVDRPIAFVRPVTIRHEWYNDSRGPKPEYIAQVIEALRPTHHIVCVADIVDGVEWCVGAPPNGNTNFLRGELPAMQMLALLGASDIVVGGVGFIIPAAIALKKQCFVILGGMGGHNAPRVVTDPRLDCSRIGFATPKDFCQCTNMRHNCSKDIPDLMQQFGNFRARHCTTASPESTCNGFPNSASAISL
jgi:hypothetical protein